MTLKLLPVEVPPDSISDPMSRIITPQVINAYIEAAGDFMEAVRELILRNENCASWEACVHVYSCPTACCVHGRNSYGRPTIIPQTMEKTMPEVRETRGTVGIFRSLE